MGILTNNITGINTILPHKNKWAFDLYLLGCANNWMPTEISMVRDISDWKNPNISHDERLVIKRCLGFFAGGESLVSNNLLLSIFKYVTDAECRQYISRQQFEESLHNLTVVYICDSLNLDSNELYQAYSQIPSIKAKDDFLMRITKDIHRQDFDCTTILGKQEILRNIITYYLICEGVFFYSGFAALLAFGKQNKFNGIAEQIQYTLKDEALHVTFGTNLINKIKQEENDVWTKDFIDETLEHFKETVQLEIDFANDILPTGILGLNSDMLVEYVKYLANRRLDGIGLPAVYHGVKNPFTWLSEVIDLPKMKNFFESRVTEYQVGTLVEDW